MSFKKISTQVKNQILAYIKTLVGSSVYEDIRLILSTCCKPVLTVNPTYSCSGTDTIFSFSVSNLKKSSDAILTFTILTGGATVSSVVVFGTTNSSGEITTSVTIPTYVASGTATFNVGVVYPNSQVIISSESVEVTGIPNCN